MIGIVMRQDSAMGTGQIGADGPAQDGNFELSATAHAALDAGLQSGEQDSGLGDPSAAGGFSDTSSLLDNAIMGLQIAQRTARGAPCRFPVLYRCTHLTTTPPSSSFFFFFSFFPSPNPPPLLLLPANALAHTHLVMHSITTSPPRFPTRPRTRSPSWPHASPRPLLPERIPSKPPWTKLTQFCVPLPPANPVPLRRCPNFPIPLSICRSSLGPSPTSLTCYLATHQPHPYLHF